MAVLDWIMILAYFGVLGGVVWWSMRRNKIESEEDLFLGGRSVGWLAIGASIFAAKIGSSLTAPAPDHAHLDGLNFSCLSPEYKKTNRESWNWIDVVASIIVVGCVVAAYAYFWTWLD